MLVEFGFHCLLGHKSLVECLDVFFRHVEVRGASGWINFFRGSRMPIRNEG